MSLLTHLAFIKALRADSTLMAMLPGGDVYCTAITLPDEDLDNADLPYIIVKFDSLEESEETKDDSYGSDEDDVQVGIVIAAKKQEELGTIATRVRNTLKEYFSENCDDTEDDINALIPNDTHLKVPNGIQYDSMKPCFWVEMLYMCNTNTD